MKNLLFVIVISFFACSEKPEPILELSNPEAFSFDLGDSWEVNGSVNVIGFVQEEKDDEFHAELIYSVDLITPESDTLVAIYNDKVDERSNEEIMDIILESQIEIDNSFGEGDYKIIYNITDKLSNKVKSITIDFNLTK